MRPQTKIDEALNMIDECGGFDGGHHKQWVLDQVVRILTQENYNEWVREYEDGCDGQNTYSWDIGIAP